MPHNSLTTGLFDRLDRSHLVEELDRLFARDARRKTAPPPVVELLGPHDADLVFLTAALARRRAAPLLIVAPRRDRAEKHYDDLFFFGFDAVYHFPAWELLPFEQERPSLEIMSKRMDTLAALAGLGPARDGTEGAAAPPPMISASIDALQQKTVPPDWLRRRAVVLEWGAALDLGRLGQQLDAIGYAESPMVEARGEYSLRGGILDIFPPDADHPFRLDLFGDEIESIRRFDLGTQRSIKEPEGTPELTRVVLLPANEAMMIELAEREGVALVPFFEHLPAETIIVHDAPELFETVAMKFDQTVAKELARIKAGNSPWVDRTGRGRAHPDAAEAYKTWEQVRDALAARAAIEAPHVPLPPAPGDERARRRLEVKARSFADVKPDLETYLGVLRARQAEDYLVVVACDNWGQVCRLEEILRDQEIACRKLDLARHPDAFRPRDALEGVPEVMLVTGDLSTGFVLPEAHLILVTDREMFGRYKRRHVYRKIYKGTPIRSMEEVARDDYVVHVEHGIGRYVGIRRQRIDGVDVDLIELVYKDDDRLLVPVDKVHYVQKYSAGEAKEPQLDKLGGNAWKKRKAKSAEKIEQMANDLLALYAQREMAGGHAFAPDNHFQQEFEASFLYQETPDQLQAIEATKRDMESMRPMDRLVCGDVGFGKTEVAIRAAFKAIQDGRQVALLCPTTVLAQQHYNTFRERYADYPIGVEILSRFQSAKEVADGLRRLALGESQLAIGTHRLLSKDVKFADLGLLIIDEEQRFGVAHKEKFKQLRASLDVLTLSATPIPRTLYMALSGLRDMSLIATAPAERYPVRTRTIRWEKDAIEEAILRELNRGGQVYFIHNRVHNIAEVTDRLREIVPNARIAVGHGQMGDADLEKVMTNFVNGEVDILIATTIVENGLDIPNCNTIVINRADAFGLAQLYQLRGRVGRATRQAYAYLILPEGVPISEAAVKRLEAIEEFTELGVGFQIAVRDMEIRGTGNILGSEQHGTMEAIGFELYCEMLEAAVKQSRGDVQFRPIEVEVSWRVASFIPPDYIPVEAQRFALYKRLASARSVAEVDELAEEVKDRFGRLPDPVDNLLKIGRLRVLAAELGVRRIGMAPEGFRVEHGGDKVRAMAVWTWLEQHHPGVKGAVFASSNAIVVTVNQWDRGSQLNKAFKLLRAFGDSIETALGGAKAGERKGHGAPPANGGHAAAPATPVAGSASGRPRSPVPGSRR